MPLQSGTLKGNSRRTKGNNKTTMTNHRAVDEKLNKELKAKMVIKSFLRPAFADCVISQLSSILRAFTSFLLSHIDNIISVIKLIHQASSGAILAKTDIEHRYKLIPIHPKDIPALWFHWCQHWVWDATLPMASRSDCTIFVTFSVALLFVVPAQRCGHMHHILDKFHERPRYPGLCGDLGIYVIATKTKKKGTCIVLIFGHGLRHGKDGVKITTGPWSGSTRERRISQSAIRKTFTGKAMYGLDKPETEEYHSR